MIDATGRRRPTQTAIGRVKKVVRIGKYSVFRGDSIDSIVECQTIIPGRLRGPRRTFIGRNPNPDSQWFRNAERRIRLPHRCRPGKLRFRRKRVPGLPTIDRFPQHFSPICIVPPSTSQPVSLSLNKYPDDWRIVVRFGRDRRAGPGIAAVLRPEHHPLSDVVLFHARPITPAWN